MAGSLARKTAIYGEGSRDAMDAAASGVKGMTGRIALRESPMAATSARGRGDQAIHFLLDDLDFFAMLAHDVAVSSV
jgi:hypothetical protein